MGTFHWAGLSLDRPLVMGILNVTPDSFSDGGRFLDPQTAIAAGRAMLEQGADILDIGGESTRPEARLVRPEEEIARLAPVIAALAAEGAVISAAKCPVVLMHMRGTPMTMNCQAHYADLVPDVLAELIATRDAAIAAGIAPDAIALDPGLGFAKIGAQNLDLLRATSQLAAFGHPVIIGVSRKKFIGAFGGEPDATKRLPGSLAAGLFAVAQGAHILRVHDVAATVQGLKIWQALTHDPARSAKSP
jgi:dihydropteroate synthase